MKLGILLFKFWLIGTVIFGPSTAIVLGVAYVHFFGVPR